MRLSPCPEKTCGELLFAFQKIPSTASCHRSFCEPNPSAVVRFSSLSRAKPLHRFAATSPFSMDGVFPVPPLKGEMAAEPPERLGLRQLIAGQDAAICPPEERRHPTHPARTNTGRRDQRERLACGLGRGSVLTIHLSGARQSRARRAGLRPAPDYRHSLPNPFASRILARAAPALPVLVIAAALSPPPPDGIPEGLRPVFV